MTSANDRQEGGDHYKKRKYQHWDMVCDTKMHYLAACATKYISRWRDKNGVEDLKKALHYIDKAKERKVKPVKRKRRANIHAFAVQLPHHEGAVLFAISLAKWDRAKEDVEALIDMAELADASLGVAKS